MRQSSNHVNSQGIVPIEFNGYQVSTQQASGITKEITPGRATPFVFIAPANNKSSGVAVYIKDFWQKFPKAIAVNSTNIVLGLFPQQALDGFELQPGEKKSDSFYISYHNDKNSLLHFAAPIHAAICAQYLASTKAIPFFASNNDETDNEQWYLFNPEKKVLVAGPKNTLTYEKE